MSTPAGSVVLRPVIAPRKPRRRIQAEPAVVLKVNTTAKAATPKKKKIFVFTGKQSFVKIHVGTGNDANTFEVTKNLICHYSPFFAAAFESEFVEGQTQEMKMEDVESEIFGLLVAWVTTKMIWNGESERVPAVDLAKLWVLADRCLIPELQNLVIKKLGSPIGSGFISKELGEYATNTAKREFIEYVRDLEGGRNPLKRYCTQVLLHMVGTVVERSRSDFSNLDEYGSTPTHPANRQLLMSAFRPGLESDLIQILMNQINGLSLSVPMWDASKFVVQEED